MRFFLVFWVGLTLAALAVGCSSTPVAPDVGPDANEDAYVLAIQDAGHCDLACPSGRACCFAADGTPRCVDLSSDITNCGICGRDCVASRRGDSCANNQCGCGDFEIGCTGAENSICCPSVAGIRPYCANPGLDFSDCGGCGRACNDAEANHCSGGVCLCGDRGGSCAGTATALCCSDPAGAFSCVDTTTDQAHCGRCGQRCSAFDHCVSGVCVPVRPDAGLFDGGSDAG